MVGSFHSGIGEDRVLALSRLISSIVLHTINWRRGENMLNVALIKAVCGKAVEILRSCCRLSSNYCLQELVSFKTGRLGMHVKSILNVGSPIFKVV
jgi:hypothetical protein